MPTASSRRLRAAVTLLAPAMLVTGALYHPNVGDPTEADFTATIAAAVAADTLRWGLAHLAIGVGSGLLILAFLAVRSHLRKAGEERWSAGALPCIVLGSTLFALLPAMEFAPLAAAETGADLAAIQAAQDALLPWFVPILVTSAILFGLGALGFALAIARSNILNRPLTWIVVSALAIMGAARLAPIGAALPTGALASLIALWPLANAMRQAPPAQSHLPAVDAARGAPTQGRAAR